MYKDFWTVSGMGEARGKIGWSDKYTLQIHKVIKPYLSERKVVLDFGCGAGRMMKAVAPYCKLVVGVDISTGMINCAKEYLQGVENVRLVHMKEDMSNEELEGLELDFWFSILVFQHVEKEDMFFYLNKLKTLMKVGGKGFFQIPFYSKEHFEGWLGYKGPLNRDWNFGSRVRPSSYEETKLMLDVLGLRILDMDVRSDNTYILIEKEG